MILLTSFHSENAPGQAIVQTLINKLAYPTSQVQKKLGNTVSDAPSNISFFGHSDWWLTFLPAPHDRIWYCFEMSHIDRVNFFTETHWNLQRVFIHWVNVLQIGRHMQNIPTSKFVNLVILTLFLPLLFHPLGLSKYAMWIRILISF